MKMDCPLHSLNTGVVWRITSKMLVFHKITFISLKIRVVFVVLKLRFLSLQDQKESVWFWFTFRLFEARVLIFLYFGPHFALFYLFLSFSLPFLLVILECWCTCIDISVLFMIGPINISTYWLCCMFHCIIMFIVCKGLWFNFIACMSFSGLISV